MAILIMVYGWAGYYSYHKIRKDKPLYNNIIRFSRRMSIMMLEQDHFFGTKNKGILYQL